MSDYGVRELAEALVQARKWRNAAPAIRDYYAHRLVAMQAALGVDGKGESEDGFALGRLLNHTVDMIERDKSPFNPHLDTPPVVATIQERHTVAINKAAEGFNTALLNLVTDLLVALYAIPADVSADDEDLRHAGFDPDAPAPNPFDTWG